jgi:hypothetical protein
MVVMDVQLASLFCAGALVIIGLFAVIFIDNIIKNCPLIWFSFGGGQQLETKLDTVDYADIDVSSTKKGEQPTTNAC